VGKSSLINCLVNQKTLARTSSTPGKTQLINFYLINDHFFLVDLPGFGYAKVPLPIRKEWEGMIAGYFNQRSVLKGVCWLFDIRREPGELDFQTRKWLVEAGLPYRLVFTKADKLSLSSAKTKSQKIAAALAVPDYQIFSVLNGTGKMALWQWLKNHLDFPHGK